MKIRNLVAKAKKRKVKSTLLDRMQTADDPNLFVWPKEPKYD